MYFMKIVKFFEFLIIFLKILKFYANFEFFWEFEIFEIFWIFWKILKFYEIFENFWNFWILWVYDIGYKWYRLGTIIDNAYTKHLYFNLNIWYIYIYNIYIWSPFWAKHINDSMFIKDYVSDIIIVSH
jgi:hypothetical protein